VKGYKTTFGASPYKDQTIDRNATVFERLTAAGAVLVAKLTLAPGHGRSLVRRPDEKSLGSQECRPRLERLVGRAGLGRGSRARALRHRLRDAGINHLAGQPLRRHGSAAVLRPVSRHGAMALSWTMDKLGPLARTAEDCAVVLSVIQGPDGKDNTVLDVPFAWDAGRDVRRLRVGYLKSDVERDIPDDPKNPDRVQR